MHVSIHINVHAHTQYNKPVNLLPAVEAHSPCNVVFDLPLSLVGLEVCVLTSQQPPQLHHNEHQHSPT